MHLVIESNLLQPKFMPPKDPSTHALSAPVRWEYPETPAVERGNTVENKNAPQQQQHKQQTTTGQGAGTTRTRTAITAIITISTITVEQVRIIHSILGILTMGTEIPMNLLMTPSPGIIQAHLVAELLLTHGPKGTSASQLKVFAGDFVVVPCWLKIVSLWF